MTARGPRPAAATAERVGATRRSRHAPFPNQRWLLVGAGLVLLYVLVVNAWVSDDAYITLRTVDNLVHGHGLTWNIDERVQAYTHPLWMLVVAVFYFFTREGFFTSIVLSLVFTIAAVLLAAGIVARVPLASRSPAGLWRSAEPWRPALLALALMASKAFIDFSTAGLENALSYLLAALFMCLFLSDGSPEANGRPSSRSAATPRLLHLTLIASLAYVNRPDTVFLYAPALGVLVVERILAMNGSRSASASASVSASASASVSSTVRVLALGLLPALAWTCFALLYYGFPFPNTAYAKMMSTAIPASWKLQRGFEYLANSLSWDTASQLMVLGAIVLSLERVLRGRREPRGSLLLLAGVILYYAYVIVSAAAATHMSGRFFSVPFFIGITLFIRALPGRRLALALAILLAGYLAVSPIAAPKFATAAYHSRPQRPSSIDAKWYSYEEGSALMNWRPGKSMPAHPWLDYGRRMRSAAGKVHVGGAFELPAIGFAGYGAGPGKFIVDKVGLSDPLLARLPARRPESIDKWKSGHFVREIPEGYVESVAYDVNAIVNPQLRLYYEKIRSITRGPIFSASRWADIWKMNLGRYDFLLQDYESRALTGPDGLPLPRAR